MVKCIEYEHLMTTIEMEKERVWLAAGNVAYLKPNIRGI